MMYSGMFEFYTVVSSLARIVSHVVKESKSIYILVCMPNTNFLVSKEMSRLARDKYM